MAGVRRKIEIEVEFLLIDRCFDAIISEDGGQVEEDSRFRSVFESPLERMVSRVINKKFMGRTIAINGILKGKPASGVLGWATLLALEDACHQTTETSFVIPVLVFVVHDGNLLGFSEGLIHSFHINYKYLRVIESPSSAKYENKS